MKNFLKTNFLYVAVIALICFVMIFFISKKEGFHEDEMFSYGSSNYAYDNVFRPYGTADELNTFIIKGIVKNNFFETLKNFNKYFIFEKAEKEKILSDIHNMQKPVWKTNTEAKQYLSIQKDDILNYKMVYYNQSRDIHPPLFYFFVHTVSILFFNRFSKYIIFIINLSFMILSLITVIKIFKTAKKNHLIIPALIFYGFSMGAVSTVMFQRMYGVLTFFVLRFILIHAVIIKNNLHITKDIKKRLFIIILLGFLTQYYFCIVAATVFFFTFIFLLKENGKAEAFSYLSCYLKSAAAGIVLYPFCINDIFFSYRGVKSVHSIGFLQRLPKYFDSIGYSFSISFFHIALMLAVLMLLSLVNGIKTKNYRDFWCVFVLNSTIVIYVCIVAAISPVLEDGSYIRYIMCILSVICLAFMFSADAILKNKIILKRTLTVFAIIICVNGLIFKCPKFLYKNYNKYISIAKTYQHDKFVYVGDSIFNHIQSMPEFAVYSESLILNENQLDYLDNQKIKNSNEFILSIKKYKDADAIFDNVLKITGFSNSVLLYDDLGEVGCRIYRVFK